MPDYRNPATGVVVSVPAAVGDRLVGFQSVAPAVEPALKVDPKRKTAPRRKSTDK